MKHLIKTTFILLCFLSFSQKTICAQDPEPTNKEIQFSSSTNKSTAKFPRKPSQIPIHGLLINNELILTSFAETYATITVSNEIGSIIIYEDTFIIDEYIITLPENCHSGSITVTINSIDYFATF